MSKLQKCKECGKEVSKNAKVCPHCGEPNPVKNGVSFLTGSVIILLASVGMLVYFSGNNSTVPRTAKPIYHNPYANKSCNEKYEIFMKRNESQYEAQGKLIRTDTGTLPSEARIILRECSDKLDVVKVGILNNFVRI